MDALQLLTWSLILYLFASLASLFLLGLDRLAIKLSGITSLVGGVIGIISGITQLHAGVGLFALFIDLYARIRGQRRGGDGLLYESFHRIDGCPAGDGQRFLVHRAV